MLRLKKWLENNCDPRPVHQSDGYSRYGNYDNFREENASELSDREHMEEWPVGGTTTIFSI
jgi:hypothetical protein